MLDKIVPYRKFHFRKSLPKPIEFFDLGFERKVMICPVLQRIRRKIDGACKPLPDPVIHS